MIRVALAPMPALHRGIVAEILGAQPDMTIVASANPPDGDGADVLLVSAPELGPLEQHLTSGDGGPRCGIVLWDSAGPDSMVLDLHLHCAADRSWPESLVEAVRACVRACRPPERGRG